MRRSLLSGLLCFAAACGGDERATSAPAAAPAPVAAFPLRAVVAPAVAELEAALPATASVAPAERERVRGLAATWADSPDPSFGGLAREELVGLGEAAVPELVALAGDAAAPAPQRGAALELLGAIGSPAALEALLVTLETPNIEPWLHASAAWALRESEEDWVLPRLILRLKYEVDHETVLWIADRLARSGNDSGLEGALVVWRTAADEQVKADAEALLVGIAERAGASDAAQLAQDWQAGRVPAKERSPRWRLETWRWIARLEEYQLRGVDDARFLLARSCAAAAPLLAEALHEESVYVRVHAAQCLERMGPRGAVAGAELLAALAEPSLAPNAAEALGGVRYAPALPALARLCARGGDPELRLSAVRALGAYGPGAPADAAAALVPLLAEAEPLEVRQAAAESLARIDSPDAPVGQLAAFLTDDRVTWETSERALREWLARAAAGQPAAAQALDRWDALPAEDLAAQRAARRALIEELVAGP